MKNESRFGNEYYSNGLEFTKDVLRASSSIEDIIEKAHIVEETKEEMEERIRESR
ncbi:MULTISPECIES: hypothetical protein [unclassified Romboutsia]|uniref:hypothetical protein n=1 Tax=unclassified Romboutsia TaxID=2626894 RepID=UPI0008216F68|nr:MULTISPECIES: hypothetical protein [unclassified Romboutsia]SCI15070.1 Uncharacterised protein [uncultured Clostridium sp.]